MTTVVLTIVSSALFGAAEASPRYQTTEIVPGGELQGFWTAHMNDDSASDLLVAVWSQERGRELLIYLQKPTGAFPAAPDRRVKLLSDIVAFSTADLRPDPGEELILFTRSACFSFSTLQQGYSGNARKLFDWSLICAVPDLKEILKLDSVVDICGDQTPEILVPGWSGYALFASAAAEKNETFEKRAQFTVQRTVEEPQPGRERQRQEQRREVRIELGLQSGATGKKTLSRWVTRWGEEDGKKGGYFIDEERWIPAVHIADVNGDGRKDLMILDGDAGTKSLEIFHQQASGLFSDKPDQSAPMEGAEFLWPGDVDGDGRIDVMAGDTKRSDSTTVRIYRNREGRFALEKPDQVMKFSGYGAEPRLVDIEGDGRPELSVSSFRVSTLNALRGGAVVRALLLYPLDPEAVFTRRPAARHEESFTAKQIKGLGQRIDLTADVRGDGRRDALMVDRDGALVARAVETSLTIKETPFFRFVPRKMILDVKPVTLNSDGRSDMILRHMRSLTILVSR